MFAICFSACSESGGTTDAGVESRRLVLVEPAEQDVGVAPGAQAPVTVRYMTETLHRLGGQQIQFAIFGDPRGSTLSADSAITGADGQATVSVRAGALDTNFEVRISAPLAEPRTLYVQVSGAPFASLSVTALYPAQDAARAPVQTLEFLLFTGQTCSTLLVQPNQPALRRKTTNSLATEIHFGALTVDTDWTILVRALEADGQHQAAGCVSTPAGSLAPDATIQVAVELSLLSARIDGAFALQSTFELPATHAAITATLAPWIDLTDCAHDPIQLLLDCIVDALDVGDPLDCAPTAPSSNTQAIIARRGQLIGGCRQETTAGGKPSLEAMLQQRIATTPAGGAMLALLQQVPAAARDTLSALGLASTLTLSQATSNGEALASHRVTGLRFHHNGDEFVVSVADSGARQPLADAIAARLDSRQLVVGAHDFSLRYGRLARAAIGSLVLASEKLPADSQQLLLHLVEQVTEGTQTGCSAIEELVCSSAGLTFGCLGTACTTGIATLAQHLDRGFSAPTGGIDLRLGGTVQIGTDAALQAHTLGSDSTPGKWATARVHLSNDPIQADIATFIGTRSAQ